MGQGTQHEGEPEDLTPERVLEELSRLDEEDRRLVLEAAGGGGNPVAAVPAKTVTPSEPAKPADEVSVAWKVALRDVKKTCPDLDDADVALLRAAHGTDPVAFMDAAERLQDKIGKIKIAVPADPQVEKDKQVTEIARKVFGGGPAGGDPVVTPKPAEPTAEERQRVAVEKGDSKGIMKGLIDVVKDKKLFDRGVTIVE